MADPIKQRVLVDLTMDSPPSNMASSFSPSPPIEPLLLPAATSSGGSSSAIVNPYTKKKPNRAAFIGGAEAARQKARKKPPTRIVCPGEEQAKNSELLSTKLNTFERFFAALFRSPAPDFFRAADSSAEAARLWSAQCRRVGLAVPTQAVRATYDTASAHFDVRAALVLEEARNSVSQALQAVWRRRQQPMYLTAHLAEKNNAQGHVKITFASQHNFSVSELYNIRPGAIFQCLPRDEIAAIQYAVLGVVVTGNRDTVETKKCFTCLFFRPDDLPVRLDDCEFAVTPVTQLVTELRCFEAMTVNTTAIGFLPQLLGQKGATHTRFSDDQPPHVSAAKTVKTVTPPAPERLVSTGADASHPERYFNLPTLNTVQEDAATAFLRSEQNTITLVQGPPGTGAWTD